MLKLIVKFLAILICLLSAHGLQAGSATWASNPVSGDWNSSANWVPMTIPNGPADEATFGTSSQTNISVGTRVEISGITFNADAGDYVITADSTTEEATLLIDGAGIVNNSGRVQNLVADPNSESNIAYIVFGNNATAGSGMQITNRATVASIGNTQFNQAASAGSATIINASGPAPDGRAGSTWFADTSSASTATIVNETGGGHGGFLFFSNISSAADATIINQGATASGPFGTETRFVENSTAGGATLIAYGGSNGGDGGVIRFSELSSGGTARVEIFGNARLDLQDRYSQGVTIGSLEGSGMVFTAYYELKIGSNNASTTFSGMIRGNEGNSIEGTLTKIGTGTLTLSGTGSLPSALNVNEGKLELTGSMPYAYSYVNEGGTLSGSGTTGNVYVNRLGVVAPGQLRTLHLGGSYEQHAGGILRMEVAGTASGTFDHLSIVYEARLDGTLEIRFVNGFLPVSGQVFKIFHAGFGSTGSFARIVFPDLRSGFQFQPAVVNDTYQITALNDGVPATGFLNISTRMRVGAGDNALIGGFIITGTTPKRVILRAIGPSLTGAGKLADPTLELRGPSGELIVFNDNWMESAQAQEIIESGIPPTDEHEAAIIATLEPGTYTAIMRGSSNTTGIGVVEVYDLSQGGSAKLDNISSRGFVESGDNVMIAGFIADNQATQVMVRALGPSLAQSGVPDALADPTLTLYDAQGAMLAFNNDWRDADQATIAATGIPPSDDKESAILATLAPGGYTAIVRGLSDTIGVGLVEVYNLH